MANIKSSKKAIKVIAIADNNVEEANTLFKSLQKYVDQAVSKGLVKNNTADRQKARLANKIKNMK